jgi:hypothetical protein
VLKPRAERRLGDLLAETVKPGRPDNCPQAGQFIPEGISRNQSAHWQRAASILAERFEAHIAEVREAGELTTEDCQEKFLSARSETNPTQRGLMDMTC